VGASSWFVRIPFIAEGMVQGLVGAGLAILAVLSLRHFGFDQAFKDPNSFFSEFYVTSGDTTWIAIKVLIAGMGIGLIGATIGLRRFLKT
jgi:cell division transport system permease protein